MHLKNFFISFEFENFVESLSSHFSSKQETTNQILTLRRSQVTQVVFFFHLSIILILDMYHSFYRDIIFEAVLNLC